MTYHRAGLIVRTVLGLALGATLLGARDARAAGSPDFDAVAWEAIGCGAADGISHAGPGAVDFVGDATYPAAYFAHDASYLYFRYRMDRDPAGPGGFTQYSWTALMQVPSGNPFQYQYQLSLEGNNDDIEIWQNTVAEDVSFSPLFHDDSEVEVFSQPYNQVNPSTVNTSPLARRLPTGDGSNFNKDDDYFVDFAFPVATLVANGVIADATDLGGSSFFPATSTNGNNYNKGYFNCPFLPVATAAIEKSVTPAVIPANHDTAVGYTIAVRNAADIVVKGLVIDDIALATYLTNPSATVSADDPSVTWEIVSMNPLQVKVPRLPVGATVTVDLSASAAATCADADFTNTATTSATNAMDETDSALLHIHHLDGFELCDAADNDCNGIADDGGNAICDDGDACNGSETCGGAAGCQTGTAPDCDDANACTADACDAEMGCVHTALDDGSTCSDSDACTTGDACQSGACVGSPVTCAASDQCHVAGTCDPETGSCSNPAASDGTACNDGNACTTGTDTCQGGACTGSSSVVCTALDACHAAGTCDPATGVCSNPTALDGATCDDSDPCTSGDACHAGTCSSTPIAGCVRCTTAADCGDGSSCTTDVCGPSGVCTHQSVPGCVPCTTAADCDDHNACTSEACGSDNSCAVTTIPGCQPCATAADCNDHDACTADTCSGGTCQHASVSGCGEPHPVEICGNCIDDDGDGLVDAEDPDCCDAPTALDLPRLKLKLATGKARANRLSLKARYAASMPASFDPTGDDTSIQISDANGQVFCQTVAARNWTHPRRPTFRFKDKKGLFAGGLRNGNFRLKKTGEIMFRTRGKRVTLRATDGHDVNVTVRVGDRCAQSQMTLRPKRKGLVFP